MFINRIAFTNISYLLLGILIYLSFGYILIFNPIITLTKEIIWKKLEKDHYKEKIELMVFNRKDLEDRRIDYIRVNQKEFRLNGNMYDIVKEWEDGDSVYFHCYLDMKETFFQKLFFKHLDKTKKDKQSARLIAFSNILIAVQPDDDSTDSDALQMLDLISNHFHLLKQKNYPRVASPPPKILS